MNNATCKVTLPVRVGHAGNGKISIQCGRLADAGWSTIECDSADHARQIMASYPSAAMPGWRNPSAAWNR